MVDLTSIKNIAVIGGGTMGSGIAQVALLSGYEKVTVIDLNPEILEKSKQLIQYRIESLESVEKFNQFMSQVTEAGDATQRFGEQAQSAASQITSSFSGAATNINNLQQQLTRLSPEQLAAVNARVEQLTEAQMGGMTANEAYAQAFHEMGISADGAGKSIEGAGQKTKDGAKKADEASSSFIALGAAHGLGCQY